MKAIVKGMKVIVKGSQGTLYSVEIIDNDDTFIAGMGSCIADFEFAQGLADKFNKSLSEHVRKEITLNNYQLVCVKDSGAWCVYLRNMPMLIVQVDDLKDAPKQIAAALEAMLMHGFDEGEHSLYDVSNGNKLDEKPIFDQTDQS
jgi:hypothetical protein